MSQIPCHPWRDRRHTDWSSFYDRDFPRVVYRVQVTAASRTQYVPDRGFVPSAGVTRRTFDNAALHEAAVNHCLGWTAPAPSPFVSLSCSFGYAIWEARRRQSWKQALKDTTVWFINGRVLNKVRPGRRHLFHAVDLINNYGPCDSALGCSADCEKSARFANVADELLVLGSVPLEAVIGRISFRELLPFLPAYFFAPEHIDLMPSDRSTQHFVEGFSEKSYREAYDALVHNVQDSAGVISPTAHAEAALSLGAVVCDDVSRIGARLTDFVQLVASDAATWLIDWTCVNVNGTVLNGQIDAEIDVSGYLDDYIGFRAVLTIGGEDDDHDEATCDVDCMPSLTAFQAQDPPTSAVSPPDDHGPFTNVSTPENVTPSEPLTDPFSRGMSIPPSLGDDYLGEDDSGDMMRLIAFFNSAV